MHPTSRLSSYVCHIHLLFFLNLSFYLTSGYLSTLIKKHQFSYFPSSYMAFKCSQIQLICITILKQDSTVSYCLMYVCGPWQVNRPV